MSDNLDESQDWPLRDYSARLRPPARPEEQDPFAPPVEESQTAFEPPPASSDVEVLYDEDELDAGIPVVDEPAAEPAPEAVPPPDPVPAQPEPLQPEPVADEQPPPGVEEHAEGEFRVPDGYTVLEGAPTGHRRTVAIVVSRFNGEITNRLLDSALAVLDEAGVTRDSILVMPVPGAFELPIAAMALAKTRRYSCVIALGAVIRGETPHFDFVASEAASGLQLAGIETGVPVSFGLLTCDTAEQAEARVERGAWAARTALEMADAFAQVRTAVARG